MKNGVEKISEASSFAQLSVVHCIRSMLLCAVALPLFLVSPQTVAAQTYTVLHSFTGGSDGSQSYGVLTPDSAGNFYGVTGHGGSGYGVVFKLDSSGNETVLHSFSGGSDGANPWHGVIRDSTGNLYGTTIYGGSSGCGVVFKLDPSGNESVLHSFTGGSDGCFDYAGLTMDSAGSLYGTTIQGGSSGNGVVYKLDSSGNFSVLYSFTGGSDGAGGDGAGVIIDSAGSLYGTTRFGGSSGNGVVFKLDASGNETVLHSFTGGNDGAQPDADLVMDSSGNLYSTTISGGSSNYGTVFKLDPSGHETVLYSFTGGSDGAVPYAGVILDSAGNLYGSTYQGGSSGNGTVFKLDPSGHETVLHNFGGYPSDGANPYEDLLKDASGNLYSTTILGGSSNNGTVFRINQGAEYAVCVLYDQSKSVKSGAVFPIKLQLCDSSGNDLSSASIVVHATQVTALSGYAGDPEAVGNANPDSDFRFDSSLGPTGGYIFNLGTVGLSTGTYSLQFVAGSDPTPHFVSFGVK